VGKVLHYYPKAQVAHIRIKAREVHKSDDLLIIGKNTGVVEVDIQSLWVEDQPAKKVTKGQECTIKLEDKVREGDKVYLWEDRD
jgi:putative protease